MGIILDTCLSNKVFHMHSFQDHNINKALQKRIENHYQYVWLRTRGVEPQTLLDGLPISLWGDVTLSLYGENINKVRPGRF